MWRDPGTNRRQNCTPAGLSALLALALLVGCAPPGIEDDTARVLALTQSSLTLAWRTTEPVGCTLEVAQNTDDGAFVMRVETQASVRHRATLGGLEPDTRYAYAIRCQGLRPFEHPLRTPPAGPAPVRIAVLGDSGKGSRGQHRLARVIEAAEPALILHTGDLLYTDDEREVFVRPYAAILPDTPFFAATGNHDLERWERFVGLFDLPDNGPGRMEPGRSYWLDRGDVRIVVIDSNHGPKSLRYEIGPWLEQVLAQAPEPRWRIVVMHHPPYTWGRHGPILPLQDEIVPLLESSGVDLVLSGHDHNYQRTAPMRGGVEAESGERGVVYVVTGAGGGELYEMEGREGEAGPLRSYRDDVYSFTQIDASEQRLEVRQIAADGKELDAFEIGRTAAP